MIPPYTLPLTGLTEWDRCAWLVPVRGSFPWTESTSGVLLGSSHDMPVPPSAQANEIAWTPRAISRFWEFLLRLRDVGNLGPLGLSFHPASSQPAPDKSIRTSKTLATAKHTGTNPNSTSSVDPFVSIAAIDYIKIYHDWPQSLYLRGVLDAWAFETGERKVRVLVGAKLLLLDDKSKGVMIL